MVDPPLTLDLNLVRQAIIGSAMRMLNRDIPNPIRRQFTPMQSEFHQFRRDHHNLHMPSGQPGLHRRLDLLAASWETCFMPVFDQEK